MRSILKDSIALSGQFSYCSLPIRLDSYRGCGFACSYCFARRRGGNVVDSRVLPARPDSLEQLFSRVGRIEPGKGPTIDEFIFRRVPLHFGGMSDPFQPAELRYCISLAYLRTLAKHRYPVVISTKGDLILKSHYLDLLRSGMPVVVQFSVTSTDDVRARRVEPSATPPSRILRAMETLSAAGVTVTCRWQPYIPGLCEDVSTYVRRVADTGARHVALEHLKVPVERSNLSTSPRAGAWLDVERERYHAVGSIRDGREYVLPPLAKLTHVLAVRKACHAAGLSFGAADNEFQYLSDGEACCSGVDRFAGFENVFRRHIGIAIRRSVGRNSIQLSSISSEWAPVNPIDRWLNSRSRLGDRLNCGGSIDDHLAYRWDTPRAPSHPTSFFGVEPTDETSSDGHKVFRWATDIRALVLGQIGTKPIGEREPDNHGPRDLS
jgi:DNA repair photolyase